MLFYRWSTLRRIFKYSAPLLSLYEKHMVKKWAAKGEKHQPIFIIGAPRTGSTILYQLLTNHLDALYISNLVNICRENTFLGFQLHKMLFGNKPHNCFTSRFGRTEDGGLIAPHEGLFWYKWLPTDKHYVLPEEISPKNKQEIRDYFYAIMNYHDKPLLIKNMTFSLRLKLVAELFPNARIIYLKRNPLFTAQSLIHVRKGYHGDISIWWSLMPPNYDTLIKQSIPEQVVKQVFYVEKIIESDIELFYKQNIIRLQYEKLDIKNNLEYISKHFVLNFNNKLPVLQNIKISESVSLPQEMFKAIENEVQKLDWEDYTGQA